MRIPSNIVVTGKYTIGKEYMYLNSYKEYQGYYYELNNKIFAGEKFSTNSPELIKIESDKVNTLLTRAATYTYGFLSKIKIPNNIVSASPQENSNSYDKGGEVFLKFYCKKNNINPILIKQIDEKTYFNLKNDPIYQTIYIGTFKNKTITPDQAYSQMIGLKEFVEG